VASLSQGRTAAAQCGLFTHKSVPVIFEPPCTYKNNTSAIITLISQMNLIQGKIIFNYIPQLYENTGRPY